MNKKLLPLDFVLFAKKFIFKVVLLQKQVFFLNLFTFNILLVKHPLIRTAESQIDHRCCSLRKIGYEIATMRAYKKTICLGAIVVICLPAALSTLSACSKTTTRRLGLPPLQTVEKVDLERYTGTWYDIASFPQRFQRGCTGSTATYTLRKDGSIRVVNKCRKGSLQGRKAVARGLARVVDKNTNAKLKVSFFRPFWGDYWIIELDENYEYAVVGHPSRDYLWILSRSPTMDKSVYSHIVERIRLHGYDTRRLRKTLQIEQSR